MQLKIADQLRGLLDSLENVDDDDAQDVLCQLRDKLSRSTLAKTRGFSRALIRDALCGSNASPKEFSQECISDLSASYNHPPLGGAGCFSYESPLYFEDIPNRPLLTAATPLLDRQYTFGQAGAGGVRIVGLMGSIQNDVTGDVVANQAVSVRIEVNGKDNLTTNGTRQTFISMANFFNHGGTYFPFSRLISSRDFINVRFQTNAPALNLRPDFTFVVGPLPYLGQAVRSARDLILKALGPDSYGEPEEFDRACIEQVWDMYNERAPANGCGLTFESPTRFLEANTDDTDTPIAIPPGGRARRRIEFTQGGGMIIGMMGSVRDQATGLAVDNNTVAAQYQINGGENLNTTGRVRSFTPYSEQFQNNAGAAGAPLRVQSPFYPMRRLVSSRDFFDVTWESRQPGGGLTIIPELTLAFGRLSTAVSSIC